MSLHLACIENDNSLALEILQDEVLDYYPSHTLWHAAKNGMFKVVDTMLKRDSNMNICLRNSTPLEIAIINNHEKIVFRILEENVEYFGISIWYACSNNNFNIVNELLKKGARVTVSYLYATDCPKIQRILFEKGFEQSPYLYTEISKEKQYPAEIFPLLVEKWADLLNVSTDIIRLIFI